MDQTVRVLHLECSPLESERVAGHLSSGGYRLVIDRVQTSREMRRALEQREWDVILAGDAIPGFNPEDALAIVNEMGLSLPFIVISSSDDEEAGAQFMLAGADDFVRKRDLVRLVPAMRREIRHFRNRQARLESERALVACKEQTRLLFGAVTDLILTVDYEGRFRTVAPTSPSALCASPAEWIGKTVHDVFPGGVAGDLLNRIRHSIDGGQIGTVEYSLPIGRSEIVVEGAISPMPDRTAVFVARDVTSRKRAELQSRRQLDFTEAITTSLGEGLYTLDAQGRLTYMNPAAAAALGWTETELLGVDIHAAVHFQTADCTLVPAHDCPLLSVLKTGQTVKMEDDVFTRKDGTLLPVSYISSPITSGGEIVGAVLAFRDITERKKSEDALRANEQRFRSLIEKSSDAVALLEPDGRIVYASPSTPQVLGFTAEELIRLNALDLIHPEDREFVSQRLASVTSESGSTTVQARAIHKDGSWRFVEGTFTNLLHEPGVGAIVDNYRDITERKLAEEEMHRLNAEIESERQRLNNIVANVPGVVWELWYTLDANEERIDFINDYAEQLLGYPMSQWLLIPNFWSSIVHPDDVERVAHAISPEYVRTASRHVLEFRWFHRDGRIIWVEANYAVITDDEGRPLGLRGVTTDISERKHAENAMRSSEARYRVLFESNPHPMYVFDQKTLRFLTVNEAAISHYGFSREEFRSMTILDIRPPETIPALLELLSNSGDRRFHSMVLQHRKKDGELIDVEVTSDRLDIDGGTARVCLVNDVTERNRAEAARRQAEEKYKSIFENAVEGIFQCEPDGRFVAVNPALARILGYESPTDILGNTMGSRMQYADPQRWIELRHVLADSGVVSGFVCEVFRNDGRRIWIRENIWVVRDENGNVLYYEGSIQDVTERKLLEEQLRQAQKMEAVGQLAGGVAHDFNNLLTVISGYATLLRRRQQKLDRDSKELQRIEEAAERASVLTHRLLAFSRRQVLQSRIIDLNTVVTEMEPVLRRLISENIDISVRLAPETGNVKADLAQLEQVLMNLAVNARDAMPQGGTLTIETANVRLGASYASSHSEVVAGNYAMLAVIDSGTGMSEETKAHIFEPFFTTKEVGKGTGLGLPMVYGVVRQSGGHITVDSELGAGTAIRIYLPLIAELPESRSDSDFAQPVALPGGNETILLVEDDDGVREYALQILSDHGYHVIPAANGNEAITLSTIYKGDIALLVTDVIMPALSGPEVASRVSSERPLVKVLYVSGYADDAIGRHGVLEPGVSFLAKPFSPEELTLKVREVLDSLHGHHTIGDWEFR